VASNALPQAEVLELTVDALALQILRHVVESPPFASRAYIVSPWTWNAASHGLPWDQVEAKVTLAWDLLLQLQLIDETPGGDALTVATLTGRGRDAARRDDLQRARAETRIAMGLHSLLDGDVKAHYARGDHEIAVFTAMREVEIRMRDLAQAKPDDVGVPLVRKAFAVREGEEGPLTDRAQPPAERVATQHFFAGALGLFKNPSSHRQVDFEDPEVAAEIVLVADLLLRMLDVTEKRIEEYKRFMRDEVADGTEEIPWPLGLNGQTLRE
jgi:uncharacterized protein (TIGR02391 family)